MTRLPDFITPCKDACIDLWGKPDRETSKQLRWANGSGSYATDYKSYDLKKRLWYDAAAERGGNDVIDLAAYARNEPREKKGEKAPRAAFYARWQYAYDRGWISEPPPARERASFDYVDERGALLFQVVRFDTDVPAQRFRQRRPDGGGGWVWKISGVRRVLYRLPALIEAVKAKQLILVCEGERDADTAVKLGYAATTMCGGIEKWRAEYDEFFRSADVVVVSDNDPQAKDLKTGALKFHDDGRPVLPGQDHARNVARRLSGIAASVRVVMFPVKDLSEWVAAGGTRAELDELIARAPVAGPTASENDDAEQAQQSASPPPSQEQAASEADIEITRLAKLTPPEYEHQRREAAEKLGWRASILDKLVAGERVRLGLDDEANGKQGRAIEFPEPEPWPEPVDGAALLNATAAAIRRHVVMSRASSHVAALWTLHSWLIDCFGISPRLCVRSATKGCGKTLLLDVLGRLTRRPLRTLSITPAATFRIVEGWQPTLLIDEADTFLQNNEGLRGILDGNRKGDTVTRTVGDEHEPRAFSTYSACIIALIGTLPDTLHDRSVVVDLKRRLPKERITPFRFDRAGHLDVLARMAARWAADNSERVAASDPAMPRGVINREADNWRPLAAIASVAKGRWPARVSKAATAAHAAVVVGDQASELEMLLGDIRDGFAAKGETVRDIFGAERVEITSAALVKFLVGLEGRPWAEMGKAAKPLTQNRLARLLKALPNIKPGDVGPKNARGKGYKLDQFEDAFERYLAPEGGSQPRNRATADSTGTSDDSEPRTPKNGCADAKSQKPAKNGQVRGCADAKGETGGKAHVKSDDLPYRGPVVEVPDLGSDALDEHGQPVASGLSDDRRRELVEHHRKWAADGVDAADLEDALRSILREEMATPEEAEAAFREVMAAIKS
jgi:putative DNA primase/helicase